MKISFKKILLFSAVLSLVFLALPALAQSLPKAIGDQLQHTAGANGANLGQPTDLRIIAVNIIRVVLTFLGMIFLCIVIYAGFIWMTAAGNDDEVGKAKTMITQATVGLGVILAAYGITQAAISLMLGRPFNYNNGVWVEPAPSYFKGPGDTPTIY